MIKRISGQLWRIGMATGSLAIAFALTSQFFTLAQANCARRLGALEWHHSMMIEHFLRLQTETDYPWGNARVYDRIEGGQIVLTDDFETLSGLQKQQVVDALFYFDWRDYLSLEEYEQKFREPGIGLAPYWVFAHDGRLLSAPYDGCTRFTLLTERDRYSWYYNSQGRHLPHNLPESMLRNAGQPSWRFLHFPIEVAVEQEVRSRFWSVVGDENRDWWIAWVPERGHFEVNVPENFDQERLQRYWQVADRNYHYVVLRTDGTHLGEKRF